MRWYDQWARFEVERQLGDRSLGLIGQGDVG